MKLHIKELIVVEGITDVNFLSSFLDADFVITSGSGIDQKTIDYISEASKTRGVILLLDPDFPGEQTRKKIYAQVKNAKQAFINPKLAKKGKKLGVAESTKEEVLRALSSLVTFDNKGESLSYADFYELGLIGKEDSSQKRLIVEDYFHLGHGSAKTIFKRLNGLGITLNQIKKVLGD
jgi:ribonuclease M5